MTAALSNPPLSFAPCPRPLASQRALTLALTRSRIRTLQPLHLARSSSKASLNAAETDSKKINGGEGSQIRENTLDDMLDQKILPTMKTLIQAYKKAILDGDEKRVCEMEAAICVFESEKNNLSQKYVEVTAEMASGKAKFLRLTADFDNFRKRSEKDRITFASRIKGELFESLLPVVDSFERAKQQMKTETEKEKKIGTSYQGIYKQFVEVMRSSNVSVVGTVGKPFDPSIHEAISREESEQFKEGIVTQEIRRGFFLGDRLLRPATVKVSSGPGPKKPRPASDGSTEEQPDEAAGSVEDSMPTTSDS